VPAIKVEGWHVQAVDTRRLHGYVETNTLNTGKKDEIIKKCY
jgi:hypothetical protein